MTTLVPYLRGLGRQRRAARCNLLLAVLLALGGCASIPPESVELSATVGRDLQEVHRAHRALAEQHFGTMVEDVNLFVDRIYRPAFIAEFAGEFDLAGKVERILRDDPEKLLVVLTRFVAVATERIEGKRRALLDPIEAQRRQVLGDIEAAYLQIHAAQALVTAHLASVRKVRDVQSELLADAGLDDVQERIATTTARVSDGVAELVRKGQEIDTGLAEARGEVERLDGAIDKAVDTIRGVAD